MAKRLNLLYRLEFGSGKSYIGVSTESATRRYSCHLKDVNRGSRLPVHRAWRKHGAPKLTVLAILERDMLPMAEYLAVMKYNTLVPHGYNSVPGGGVSPSSFSHIAKKISCALKGRRFSDEHRTAISRFRTGFKASPETRALYSRLRKGRKHSDETKAKISRGNLGRVQSVATRAKISIARKGKAGRKWTDEQKRSVSLLKIGIPMPESARQKRTGSGNPMFGRIPWNKGTKKEFCKHDHSLQDSYVYKGTRHCRECQRIRDIHRAPIRRRLRQAARLSTTGYGN